MASLNYQLPPGAAYVFQRRGRAPNSGERIHGQNLIEQIQNTRERFNVPNSNPLDPDEFNPNGLNWGQLQREGRLLRNFECMQRMDTVNSSWEAFMIHPTNRIYNGFIEVYNINMLDTFLFMVIAARQDRDFVDADLGTLNLSTLIAFSARRLKYYWIDAPIINQNQRERHAQFFGDDPQKAFEFQPPGPRWMNAQASVLNYINHTKTARENGVPPSKMCINLFAPLGSQLVSEGGNFSHYIGGNASVNFGGVTGLRADGTPANRGDVFGQPMFMNPRTYGALRFELNAFNHVPFRHQYWTFTDMLSVDQFIDTRDEQVFAAIWRAVKEKCDSTMLPSDNLTVPFTCSWWQFIVTQIPRAGGGKKQLNKNGDFVDIFGMVCRSPKGDSENNCLLRCLKEVNTRYWQKSRGKLSMEVDFLTQGDGSLDKEVKKNFEGVRKILNIPMGTKIAYNDVDILQKLSDWYKVNFNILDEFGKEIQGWIYTGQARFGVSLVLYNGHYYYRIKSVNTETQLCFHCGKKYIYAHHCSLKRVAWFKNSKQAASMRYTVQKEFIKRNPNFDHQSYYKRNCQVVRDDGRTPHILNRQDTMMKYVLPLEEKLLLYYDFETFPLGSAKNLQVYAAGWYYDGKYYNSLGEGAMNCFIMFLTKLEPVDIIYEDSLKKGEMKSKRIPIKLVAWNGCKFDVSFILEYIIKSKDMNIKEKLKIGEKIVIHNGRILKVDIGEKLNVWDPMLMLDKCSLDKACEQFKIQGNKKAIFPHRIIMDYRTVFKRIRLDELNDPRYYFEDQLLNLEKSKWDEDKLEKEGIIPDRHGMYSLSDICQAYLKKDVMGMREVCMILKDIYLNHFGAYVFDFITLPSMAKTLWIDSNHWKYDILLPLDEDYDCFRGAIYGGHVDPIKRRFISPKFNLDVVKEIQYLEKDSIILNHGYHARDFKDDYSISEVDATSLYVSAMGSKLYPIGPPISTKKRVEYKMGIYYVKYKPNPWLIIPILPGRKKDGSLVWSLESGEGFYTSIDIDMAIECHYEIEIIHGVYWEECKPIFESWMDKTFKVKTLGREEKNKALANAGKLSGNATYGGLLQRDFNDDYIICHNREEAEEFSIKNHITLVRPIDEENDIYGLQGTRMKTTHGSPLHLGAFVLSYARQIMHKNLLRLDSSMKHPPNLMNRELAILSMKNTYYYTDTDSFWIDTKRKHVLELKEELGFLKDESDEKGVVVARWNPGNKDYANIYLLEQKDGSTKCYVDFKSKGVSHYKMKLGYYLAAMEGKSTEIELKDKIKRFLFRGPFMQTFHVDVKKTFNKTRFENRAMVNDQLNECDDGDFSLPYGHCLLINHRPNPKIIQAMVEEISLAKDLEEHPEEVEEDELTETESGESSSESDSIPDLVSDPENNYDQYTQISTQELNTSLEESEEDELEDPRPTKKARRKQVAKAFIDTTCSVER